MIGHFFIYDRYCFADHEKLVKTKFQLDFSFKLADKSELLVLHAGEKVALRNPKSGNDSRLRNPETVNVSRLRNSETSNDSKFGIIAGLGVSGFLNLETLPL